MPITHNDHRLITIAGTANTGKTQLGLDLADWLIRHGHMAIMVSRGAVFWLTARLAVERAERTGRPATSFAFSELVAELNARLGVTATGLWYDGRPIDPHELKTPELSSIVTTWGATAEGYHYSLGVLAEIIEKFDGWVILDGRSVNEDFPRARLHVLLTVSDEVAARRQGIEEEDIRRRNHDDRHAPLGPTPTTTDGLKVNTDGFRDTEEAAAYILPLIVARLGLAP